MTMQSNYDTSKQPIRKVPLIISCWCETGTWLIKGSIRDLPLFMTLGVDDFSGWWIKNCYWNMLYNHFFYNIGQGPMNFQLKNCTVTQPQNLPKVIFPKLWSCGSGSVVIFSAILHLINIFWPPVGQCPSLVRFTPVYM